jgi:BMFP domain-containing protein YqiC
MPMTQTSNRFFDEAARLMNDAAGVAQGVRREFDTLVRTQAERILNDLDVVRRDEFEAVKEMARLAREENEALKARIAALEARMSPVGQG